jgi:large subunit ribosomal protein L24e
MNVPQDSTIEFEKRRNIPVRYDRELVQTTLKAMKRIGEIKSRREHAFWKNRSAAFLFFYVELSRMISPRFNSMAVSKERTRASRRKLLASNTVKLVEPITVDVEREETQEKVKEKIKVPAKPKRKSALVEGGGQSMGMDLD